MAIENLLRPWTGTGCRHIPADSPYGVLDFRFAGRATTNRWNRPGEPTLYLAGDHGVALAEFARHVREDYAPTLAAHAVERRLYDLRVRVEAALDLRDPRAWAELSLTDAPRCFLDRAVARATAGYLRHATRTQALLVPSVAFLDAPARWLAVLFLDKLPADPVAFLPEVRADGTFRLDP